MLKPLVRLCILQLINGFNNTPHNQKQTRSVCRRKWLTSAAANAECWMCVSLPHHSQTHARAFIKSFSTTGEKRRMSWCERANCWVCVSACGNVCVCMCWWFCTRTECSKVDSCSVHKTIKRWGYLSLLNGFYMNSSNLRCHYYYQNEIIWFLYLYLPIIGTRKTLKCWKNGK